MTVFNKKYTEIINHAVNKDPEFEATLRFMLSKLQKDHKENCFNGVEFHDEENKVYLENFDILYPEENMNETYLIVDDRDLSYMLQLVNFSSSWVDKIQTFKDYKTAKSTPHDPSKILNLEIRQIETGEVTKQYALEVLKLKKGYVLDYYRGYPTENDDSYVAEANSVVSIEADELKDIAEMDCPVTVGK